MFNNDEFDGDSESHNKALQQCQRCKLYYARCSTLCTHCCDLSDMQLAVFLNNRKKDRKKTSSMGFVFMGLLTLLVIVVLNNRALFGIE